MNWVGRYQKFARELPENVMLIEEFQEFLVEARRELMRLIALKDDASTAEAEALHNAGDRLRKLRSGQIRCRDDIGLSVALAVSHCIDDRLASDGRRKGVKTAVKERQEIARIRKKICRNFMGEHPSLSRRGAYSQLIRRWSQLAGDGDLEAPKLSTFKEYCKGM